MCYSLKSTIRARKATDVMRKRGGREQGQGLVEYALILVLVAVVVIGILLLLGPVVGNVFSNIVNVLADTSTGSGVIANVSNVQVTDLGGGVYRLTLSVVVSQHSDVTFNAEGDHQTKDCNLTCDLMVTNVPASGTYTVSAAAGGQVSGSYPP